MRLNEAMEVIPRTLAQNCGVSVIRTVTQLRAKYAAAYDEWELMILSVDQRRVRGREIEVATVGVVDRGLYMRRGDN